MCADWCTWQEGNQEKVWFLNSGLRPQDFEDGSKRVWGCPSNAASTSITNVSVMETFSASTVSHFSAVLLLKKSLNVLVKLSVEEQQKRLISPLRYTRFLWSWADISNCFQVLLFYLSSSFFSMLPVNDPPPDTDPRINGDGLLIWVVAIIVQHWTSTACLFDILCVPRNIRSQECTSAFVSLKPWNQNAMLQQGQWTCDQRSDWLASWLTGQPTD